MGAEAITLYVIRHGQTDWNREGRLQGQQDIPLNAQGRQDAISSGRRLKAVRPDCLNLPFYLSPLMRAQETASLIFETLGARPDRCQTHDSLRELTFGAWEGMTWPEIVTRSAAEARARQRDKWYFVPPRGENYSMLSERVTGWLDTLDEDSVIISHGGVARVLLNHLCGLPKPRAALMRIHQDRILIIRNRAYTWA